MLWQRFSSMVFWTFLVSSSIALFPVAVSIWATTVLIDQRLVLLHRFTCFWASLYTWVNPQWPMTIQGREKIRDELADVLIYLVELADTLDVDLVAAARDKIGKNALKYPVEKARGNAKKYDEL